MRARELRGAALCALLLLCTGDGQAEELRLDGAAPAETAELTEVDLSEVVMSATKMVTTVQETPQIITVITDEEIRAYGFRSIADILASLPSFEVQAVDWWFGNILTRGTADTLLVMWNGVPANSPESNLLELDRRIPVELIKRIEVITGPGGVLWGANAFLGIVNIITYDGDTFSGYRFEAGGGSGPGLTRAARSTIAAGEQLLRGRLKLFMGLSFSTDEGAVLTPQYYAILSGFPPPDADGPTVLGFSREPTHNRRNYHLTFAGNVRGGPVTLDWYYPFVRESWQAVSWLGGRTDISYDNQRRMIEGDYTSNDSEFFVTALTLRSRLGRRLGVVARGYYLGSIHQNRRFTVLPPGLLTASFGVEAKSWTCPTPCTQEAVEDAFDPGQPSPYWAGYRTGGSADFDLTLWSRNRLLFGLEGFREHRLAYVTKQTGLFDDVYLMFFPGSRLMGAAFAADEWRPHPQLTLQAGVRLQDSDAYPLVTLLSGAAVWSPVERLFLKLNYAEGFRPPAFNAFTGNDNRDPSKGPTNVNPHFAANPDLRPERSRSLEAAVSYSTRPRGAARKVTMRAGYALTQLTDLIVRPQLVAVNAGERYVHTGELVVRSELARGHYVFLAASVNFGTDLETGPVRAVSNSHVTLGGRFALLGSALQLDTLLVCFGPREDLNRYIDTSEPNTRYAGTYSVPSSSVVADRIPASASWRIGLVAPEVWRDRLELSLFLYDVLGRTVYAYDPGWGQRTSPAPIPGPSWSVFGNAIFKL